MSPDEQTTDRSKKIQVFQLNEEKAKYEELELETDVNFEEIFDSNLILYFTYAEK